jgi:hypothetical protein
MLTIYDWLRRSYSGAELLATLQYLLTEPDFFSSEEDIGPPISACEIPCRRCWVYPRMKPEPRKLESKYCNICQGILTKSKTAGKIIRYVVVVWGYVSQLPTQLLKREGFYADKILGDYIHDENHFLLTMGRRDLKTWLQELLMYHGTTMKGLIQIFPAVLDGRNGTMGDVLCRAAHQEIRFPMDMLRVRFFSSPFQIFYPQVREDKGILTFEITEFLRMLEMAEIFRTLLSREEQYALHELVKIKDKKEEQFYWGRFVGYLSPKAKDMLNAWKIRQWPVNQIRLLYELVDYVFYDKK